MNCWTNNGLGKQDRFVCVWGGFALQIISPSRNRFVERGKDEFLHGCSATSSLFEAWTSVTICESRQMVIVLAEHCSDLIRVWQRHLLTSLGCDIGICWRILQGWMKTVIYCFLIVPPWRPLQFWFVKPKMSELSIQGLALRLLTKTVWKY